MTVDCYPALYTPACSLRCGQPDVDPGLVAGVHSFWSKTCIAIDGYNPVKRPRALTHTTARTARTPDPCDGWGIEIPEY